MPGKWSEKADQALARMGLPVITYPVFHNCPVALRLEVSDPCGDTTQLSHFQEAYHKVQEIYQQFSFDVLRIDVVVDDEGDKNQVQQDLFEDLAVLCTRGGLPEPQELREKSMVLEGEQGENIPCVLFECYWDLTEISLAEKTLFMEIILADFPNHGGGQEEFSSTVFFLDTQGAVLFHLYDDRGLDLVAEEKSTLLPIYQQQQHLIMGEDEERIQEIFG